MNELLNVTFAVAPGQLALLTKLPAELETQKTRVAKIEAERIPALITGFRVAGIEVPAAPVRGAPER